MWRIMIAALIVLGAMGVAAAQEPSRAEAEARLAAINTLAREHYARARDLTRDDGPAIVVDADSITLLRNGTRERVEYLPERYRHMKALGHVALGLWALLEPALDRPLDQTRRAALAVYRAELDGLLPHVGALGLRWDDAKRQREILAASLALIDTALTDGRLATAARAAWADDIGPALLGNAYDAAEAQLLALHAQTERWRASLPETDWARLRVVVLGPNRPREAHPPLAYFQRRLGEAAPSRLIVADNVVNPDDGLAILAATRGDERLAADFFRDSTRLRRGLLSEATARHLDRLLGP